MADEKTEMSGTLQMQQIESLQLQLKAALKMAETEKRMRKEQFSEASAKIAKAEEQLAKSRQSSPRLRSRNSFDSADAFLGCKMLRKTAKLILENGKEFIGFSFGAERFVVICVNHRLRGVDSAV